MNRLPIVPAALALVVGLAACGEDGELPTEQPTPDQAINTDNGGANGIVGRDDVEYVGLINVSSGGCSGVLIGPRTALTSTHCEPTVGTDITYSTDHYTVTRVISPPSVFASVWGAYDVTILRLDRNVMYPGTTTVFQPYAQIAARTISPGQNIVCNGNGPNAIINGQHVNTGATDGAANEYHWGEFHVTQVETGPHYRVVPGVEAGDSGGPCFWPTVEGIFLAGLNSSGVGREGQHAESSAIVAIAGQADAVAWINRNIR